MINTITDPSAAAYVARMIKELGVQAHDPERVAVWCYDNPPKRPRPLPKPTGSRDRHVYVSARIVKCLGAMLPNTDMHSADGLAESILLQWIQDNAPELWAMYERHDQEIEMRLAALRHNEPTLQPVEEV